MKNQALKQLLYFTIPILAFIFLTGGVTLAVASSSNNSASTQTDSGQINDLSSRVALRKTTYSVNLSKTQLAVLTSRCQPAQVKLKSIQDKDTMMATSRHDAYAELSTQLNKLIDNLEQQNTDDIELKSAAGKFNSAISKYTEDATSYKASLDDLMAMNCKTDPIGFEATLLNARELRAQLSKDAEDIKAVSTSVTEKLATTKEALGGGANR
jgi:small-conductance mechanosensitive channel